MATVTLSWPRSLHLKLLLGYAAILGVIAFPASFSLYTFLEINWTVRNIVFYDMEAKSIIKHIYGSLSSLEERHRTFVWFGEPLILKEAKERAKELETWRQQLEDLRPNPIAEDVLYDLTEQLHSLEHELDHDVKAETPSEEHDREARSQALEETYDRVRATTNTLIQQVQDAIEDEVRNLSRTGGRVVELIVWTSGIALLMALGVPWLLYRYIERPLKALHAGTERISRGDFDHTLEVSSRDELGDLARAFNRMAGRLRELDQMKADFIAVVSHELRTPLTSMLEAVNLLGERQVGTLNPDQKTLLEILKEGLLRLNELIDDLLDISKMEAKLLHIERMPTAFVDILKSVRRILDPQALEKEVRLELETPDDGPVLSIDEEKILRAVLNLVNNAIKFSPRGGAVRLVLEPMGRTKQKPLGWRLAVIDHGPGIPEAEQELIFDKFYQVKMSRQRGGTGLGLTIAREIIVAHGGLIRVESPLPDKWKGSIEDGGGPGSAFIVELPKNERPFSKKSVTISL